MYAWQQKGKRGAGLSRNTLIFNTLLHVEVKFFKTKEWQTKCNQTFVKPPQEHVPTDDYLYKTFFQKKKRKQFCSEFWVAKLQFLSRGTGLLHGFLVWYLSPVSVFQVAPSQWNAPNASKAQIWIKDTGWMWTHPIEDMFGEIATTIL